MAATWLLALALWGCEAPPPAPLEPSAIEALPDRVQRLRALERAVYEGGWDLAALEASCASFVDEELKQACLRYLGRPHLFRGAALERAGPAGASRSCPEDCRGAPLQVDCVVSLAQATGETRCDCLPHALARDECWFRVAQARGLEGGLEACLEAGSSRGPCLHHHAELFAGACPAPVGELNAWSRVAEGVGALEASVAHWDAFEREQLVDVAWAGLIRCAFERAVAFDPRLWEVLPAAAHPHLRAALAWHAVASAGDRPASLASWRAGFVRYAGSGVAPGEGFAGPEIPAGPGDDWAHDTPGWALAWGEGGAACGRPRRYFAMGKRLSSPDPALDRDLSLLEAGARILPALPSDLWEGLTPDTAELRCTVAALDAWKGDPDGS
jgi:hypothetical protein